MGELFVFSELFVVLGLSGETAALNQERIAKNQ